MVDRWFYRAVTSRAVRYVVLGCGAIGGTVAAGLARDGHDVLVCDADPAVVDAVRTGGLRIEGTAAGTVTVWPHAVLPGDLPSAIAGPVLVAVKAHHTAAAAGLLAGRLAAAGFVVSLQNGLNEGVLAGAVGGQRVVEAMVNFAAEVRRPGVIRRGNRATFVIGEPDGRITDRVRALAADIDGAEVTGNVLGYLWAKLAYGAMLCATAVSDLPIAHALADPAYAPLLVAVAGEVLAQAPVTPAGFDGFEPGDLAGSLSRLAELNRRSATPHTGVYRDLAVYHRPTEVPALLGPLTGPLVRHVVTLVEAIEAGRRTCSRGNLDLLAAYERAERSARPLNAVVTVIGAPDRAPAGPLAGRPVAVKDIIEVRGTPTRCGSPASDPAPAERDAELVRRLRDAGAEVFLTTQCLEYAAGFAHPDIGDTRNPRDPAFTSGGSSGGSAAAVAAGVCDLALGTDTGGSVRIPAAYCGIVGFKPSYGLLPLDGVFPLSPACDHAGTLTATVAGAADLVAVLAGLGTPTAAPPAGPSTVGVLAAQLSDPSVTGEVWAALDAALARLAAAGWRVTEISAPWLAELRRWEDVLAVIVTRQAHEVHRGRDTSRYAAGTRAVLAFGAEVSDDRFAGAMRDRAALTAAVDASLAGVDVLAGPAVGYTAPVQDPPFGVGEDLGESRFTGPYNLTGHPAVSVPVPAPGMPVGLQLAARRGGDLRLLRVAAAAAELLGPWHAPASATKE
jgi:2-dehydropantoate 2-reductase